MVNLRMQETVRELPFPSFRTRVLHLDVVGQLASAPPVASTAAFSYTPTLADLPSVAGSALEQLH